LWKATQLRSNWIRRARQHNIGPEEVPPVQEILIWLLKQIPFTCYYTGESLSERSFGVDHKVSIFRGGGFNLENLAVTSLKINGAKGDLSEEEFRQLLNTISTWEDRGVRLLRRLSWSNSMFKGGNH
jgi:5-methylcytosine-specific restriction endonuclease McrA